MFKVRASRILSFKMQTARTKEQSANPSLDALCPSRINAVVDCFPVSS
jgi:hypothetical protein